MLTGGGGGGGTLNHACPSCGICFSSASTLGAHVTYYCSKRPASQPAAGAGAMASAPVNNDHHQLVDGNGGASSSSASTPTINGGRNQSPDQLITSDAAVIQFKIQILRF